MNGLETNNNGGHSAHLDDLRWIDNGIREAFTAVMSSFGITDQTAVVLKGCARTLNAGVVQISEGFVSIGGELCFLPSHSYNWNGTDDEYFFIKKDFDNAGLKQYQDGNFRDTYEVRIGQVKTVAQGNIPAGHTKFEDAKNLYQIISSKIDGVPVGTVLMWSGNLNQIPSGYALCDGQNGNPDLRGRFVVGQDPRTTDPSNGIWDANYVAQNNVGGEKNHTITPNEMPGHSHTYGFNNANQGPPNKPGLVESNGHIVAGDVAATFDKSTSTTSSGGGQAHNNLPPYLVLAYIIKTTSSIPNVI